jgi:hypothetical protein
MNMQLIESPKQDPRSHHAFSPVPPAIGEYETGDPRCAVCGLTVYDYLHYSPEPVTPRRHRYAVCVTCGAINIGCERCVLTWTWADAFTRGWFTRYAEWKITWNPYPEASP